jgi:dynein heavy chain
VLAASQIAWTQDVEKALSEVAKGDKNALRDARAKQAANLKRLSEMIKGNLPKLKRLKLVTLLTIEIHCRDVLERLVKANVSSVEDFDWKKQLRFYWEKEEEEFYIRQV